MKCHYKFHIHTSLHSSIFILKPTVTGDYVDIYESLHSSIFILKLQNRHSIFPYHTSLHSSIFILKLVAFLTPAGLKSFTF